tara:strand:+ start:96 stop:314 length:219 start_codon:yes stop_codon:yes gene_type:complete
MNEAKKIKKLWEVMREPRLTQNQMSNVYRAVSTSSTLFEAQLNFRQYQHANNEGTTENQFVVLRKIFEKVAA